MSTAETKMSKKNSVKFQQILAWLMTEVMFGKAHYGIVRGLGRRDREALAAFRTAPRFFDMTLGAHADSAQMTVARIYDQTARHHSYAVQLSTRGSGNLQTWDSHGCSESCSTIKGYYQNYRANPCGHQDATKSNDGTPRRQTFC